MTELKTPLPPENSAGKQKNKAEYKGSGMGLSFNRDKNARYNERGVTPAVSTGSKEKAFSVTKSAVAKGPITITDKEKQKQAITGLNRDTKNSLNQLSEIFDKTKVEERQELAGLFGKIAYNAIHDMKDGAKKTAMHALTGGIMSKLSSGDFISGATSATVNKMLESEIRKVSKGDPATMQWMSSIVGGIASELVSGNGQIGASVAGSATKNNSLKDLIAAINGTFDADQANEDTKADDHQEPEGDIYESGAGEEESAMQDSESLVENDILPEIPLSDKDANQAIRDVVLDKSAEIAATGTVSWMSSNWLEAQYGFSRSEADAIGRNIGNNASTVWGGISYLKSVVENHRRYHSWETAIKADAYDTLPISAGIVGAAVGGALGYAPGALGGALAASGAATIYVEQKKNEWQRDEQNEKRQGK